MAIRNNITKDDEWFQHEAKSIVIPVVDNVGANVDLTGHELEWSLRKFSGSVTVYLNKVTPNITISNHIVTIPIANTDYANFSHGIYFHDLWDKTDNALLSYGDAHLRPARNPHA
jgi:hypothetical protein